MKIVSGITNALSGWKTIIGYILIQVPWFSDHPMVADAINQVLTNTSDVSAWTNLIVQLLLLVGVADILRKNVVQGTARTKK